MSEPAHVLVVAHQTACTPALLEAVKERAARCPPCCAKETVTQPHATSASAQMQRVRRVR